MATINPQDWAKQYGAQYNPGSTVSAPDEQNYYVQIPNTWDTSAFQNDLLRMPEQGNFLSTSKYNELFPGVYNPTGIYNKEQVSPTSAPRMSSVYSPQDPSWQYSGDAWYENPMNVLSALGGFLAPGLGQLLGPALSGLGGAFSGMGQGLAGILGQFSPALGGFAQSVGTPLAQAGQGLGNLFGVSSGAQQSTNPGAFTGGSGSGSSMAQFGAPTQGTYGVPWNSPEIPSAYIAGPSNAPMPSMGAGGGVGYGALGQGGAGGGALAGFATGPTTAVSNLFEGGVTQSGQGYGGRGGQRDQRFDQEKQDSFSIPINPNFLSGGDTYGAMQNEISPLGYIGKPQQQEQPGSQYQGFLDQSLTGSGF